MSQCRLRSCLFVCPISGTQRLMFMIGWETDQRICGPDIDQKLVRLARAKGHTRASGESSEWRNNRRNDIGWHMA
jgi:hypothetical protein